MQLRSLIRPVEKAWLVTSMLAEVVAKALQVSDLVCVHDG